MISFVDGVGVCAAAGMRWRVVSGGGYWEEIEGMLGVGVGVCMLGE